MVTPKRNGEPNYTGVRAIYPRNQMCSDSINIEKLQYRDYLSSTLPLLPEHPGVNVQIHLKRDEYRKLGVYVDSKSCGTTHTSPCSVLSGNSPFH